MTVEAMVVLDGAVTPEDIIGFLGGLDEYTIRGYDEVSQEVKDAAKKSTLSYCREVEDGFYRIGFGWHSFSKLKRKKPVFVRRKIRDEQRIISVFSNPYSVECDETLEDADLGFDRSVDHTLIRIGCHGSSTEIIELFAKRFGGYVLVNDFDGDWVRVDRNL